MDEPRFLELAAQFLSLPTAPLHEHFVVSAVSDFASSTHEIELHSDAWGNLCLVYDRRPVGARRSGYILATAHLDHPGLVFHNRLDGKTALFERLGSVDENQACNTGVRIYNIHQPLDQVPSIGRIVEFSDHDAGGLRIAAVEIEGGFPSNGRGCFAMWNLPPFRRRGRHLYSRACDDLAGVVVGLAWLDELVRLRAPVRAALLLTRAEEVGFAGMLAAQRGHLVDERAIFINIECSDSRAGAALGDGLVLRTGDRVWTFDPNVTAGIAGLAAELMQKNPGFQFQRRLMDGGVCEATVLARAGLRTGAVALPLDRYHNTGRDRLLPEAVHMDDALSMVALLLHIATASGGVDAALRAHPADLDKRFSQQLRQWSQRLRKSRPRNEE